jgi:hypothetical protein
MSSKLLRIASPFWCNRVQGATATLASMATTAMWFL